MVPCNQGCAEQTWTGSDSRVRATWTTCGNYDVFNSATTSFGWYVTSRPGTILPFWARILPFLAALSWNVRGYT